MARTGDAGDEQLAAAMVVDAVASGLAALGSWERQRFFTAFDRRVADVLRDSQSSGSDVPPQLEASVTQLIGSIHFHLARRESET